MDEQKARLILQSYRPGGGGPGRPAVAEALREAAAESGTGPLVGGGAGVRSRDRRAARSRAGAVWFEDADSRAGRRARACVRGAWLGVGLGAAVAVAAVPPARAGHRRLAHRSRPQRLPRNYAQEMVSFIRLAPPLEMESHDLGRDQGLAREESGDCRWSARRVSPRSSRSVAGFSPSAGTM